MSDEAEEPVVDATLVTDWQGLLSDNIRIQGMSPPVASRMYAYAGVALYESLVPAYPSWRPLAGQLNGLSPYLPRPLPNTVYDWATVASTTQKTVLIDLFKDYPPDARTRILDLTGRHLAARQAAGVPAEVIERSQAYGEDLAAALVAWAATDGYADSRGRPYVSPTGPGLWQPTPPAFAPALEPYWGDNRPFTLSSTDECAPLPPPSPK